MTLEKIDSEINSEINFKPYIGIEEKYIFISVSEDDKDKITSELNYLHDLGYNIYYLENKQVKSDNKLENIIKNASCFLIYISKNSLINNNVKDQLNFAKNYHNKKILHIYLEEIDEIKEGFPVWKSLEPIYLILKYKLETRAYQNQLVGNINSIYYRIDLTTEDDNSDKNIESEHLNDNQSRIFNEILDSSDDEIPNKIPRRIDYNNLSPSEIQHDLSVLDKLLNLGDMGLFKDVISEPEPVQKLNISRFHFLKFLKFRRKKK